MGRGRKPKPTALKVLQGNPGKRPLNMDEPVYPSIEDCPEELDERAKKEWARMTALLGPQGVITSADLWPLAVYCQAVSDLTEARAEINKSSKVVNGPGGVPMKNPWVSQANKAAELIRQFGSEFGLTPASRSRVKVAPKKKLSGMAALLG